MERDWYSYLGLTPTASGEQIAAAVERLSRQASALATTAPERSQSLRETVRKIKQDLLSGPVSRQRYDQSVAQRAGGPGPAAAAGGGPMPPARPPAMPVQPGIAGSGAGSRLARFLRTGWTCASCGNGALPSDKFCTKCGTPIQAMRSDTRDRAPRPQPACAQCANPLGPTDVFCSKCGARR